MKNVLVGSFENGRMKEGKRSKIIAERCHLGIKEIKIAKPKDNSAVFQTSPISTVRIGTQPTLMDPYEKKTIYLQSAGYTDNTGDLGDTVFAKRNIQRGEIVAYYIGVKYHHRTFKNATEIEE